MSPAPVKQRGPVVTSSHIASAQLLVAMSERALAKWKESTTNDWATECHLTATLALAHLALAGVSS